MDTESLGAAVQHASLAALALSFLAGLMFSFNPVALAAIPVSLACLTRARAAHGTLVLGGMFVAGMVLTHGLLGALAGLGGQGVQNVLGRFWGLVLGPWLILMGLVWSGWIRLPLERVPFQGRAPTGPASAMALGAVFTVAVCPVCTPALVVLLGVAAGTGSPGWGALLLLAFAAGRALPVALGAGAFGWLEKLRFLQRYQRTFDLAGGITLIVMGLYMLNAYFFVVPGLAG